MAVARTILAAHDAAELVLAAIGGMLHANITDKTYLMQYPAALEHVQPSPGFPGRTFLGRLNRVRNNFKHAGLLPHVAEWYRVVDETNAWIREWCDVYLGVEFADLDFSQLLTNDQVRELYSQAKQAAGLGNHQGALELIGRSLLLVLDTFPGIVFPVINAPKTDEALLLTAFGVSASEYLTL